MTPRRVVIHNARLAVLALLIGLAVAGLTTRDSHPPAGAPSPKPAGELGFTILVALAPALAVALVLATVAAIRHRRNPPNPPTERRRAAQPRRRLAALFLLALLTITVGGSALTSYLARPAPRPLAAPAPASPASTPAEAQAAPVQDQAWLFIAAATLLGLLVFAAIARRQSWPADRIPAQKTPLADVIHRALHAVVQPAGDPRAAIIRCYAAMESALITVPAASPHAADSPSEVLHRATDIGAIRSPGAWRLVELFDEARFSPHPMTEHDRAEAATALRVILNDLGDRR